MYAEEKIEFAVGYRTAGLEFHSERIELYEYDTVEQLKVAIHNAFDIPPHKQIIEGWKQVPEDDLTILQVCSNLNRINYLNVGILETENAGYNFTENIPVNNDNDEASDEIRATRSCFQKICTHIATSHVKFNIATLKHAKETVLLAPPQTRKVILLYLHNSKDKFSNIFLRKLNSPRISEILIQSFYVLGWDVENDSFHRALTKVLVETDLEHLSALIQTQTCAAILLQNINGTIKVLSLLIDDKPEEDTFYMCLKNCHDYLTVDHNMTVRTDSAENNDIDAAKFQRLMADMLGDRDYDCFAFDQHEFLKQKIGYALFGQPTEQEDGQGKYKEKDKKRIDIIYEAIKKHSNKFAEYRDQVEISFIYNVMEPLDKEKEVRARKIENYNPNTDISPVPIFVLRKCRETEGNACRIFIDDTGRVYDTWKGYLEDNKLPKCNMVLPENGRYEVIGQDVLLERHKSPECNISKSFLKAGDIGSAIGGVGSGTVLVGAGIASITLAPAAIIAAGVVGGVAGVYALGRSAAGLVDRLTHDEDMSIMNSEARGIYFNLLAGTLGFAGAGANLAVSQLAARGFNIGQGVGAVVNTIGVANMGVSGASIINSGYDVFDQWYNENQTPSLLTIVQLSSSILFFGNAVYNFKTCQTIVEESQTKVLQEYQDSLRSNRHRKTFNKMMKETIRRNDGNQVRGKAETIKTIRNIPNKDEMFAALTRNNKLMNKNGVRFFASNGDITLNGQTVNMNEFVSMNRQQANAFLSNLPTETNISISDTTSLINDFSLNRFSLPTVDVEFCARYALRLIGVFGIDVRKMLMQVVDDVLNAAMRFFKDILDELFPKHPKFTNILNVVMEYFGGKAADYLQKYYKWRSTGSPYYYDRGFVDIPQDRTARYVWIFEKVVKLCFSDGHLVEYELRDIIKYLEGWLVNKLFEDQQNEEASQRKLEHSPQPATSVTCKVCAGKFFKGD